MRVRYEVFLGGRLLKETERRWIGPPQRAAEPADEAGYIDGQDRWMVDQQYVAEDVALAMISQAVGEVQRRAADRG